MLICPKCNSEYQEGFTTCSDCECGLVEILEANEEEVPVNSGLKISQFVIGILIILCSPIVSYRLTSMYFIPTGNAQYINEQFIWMLNAYHYSFLLIGGIICLPYILYWYKASSNK